MTAIRDRVDCTEATTHFVAFSVAEATTLTDATRRFDAFIAREMAVFCWVGDAGAH